jgi:small subunit ribosomal protein S8
LVCLSKRKNHNLWQKKAIFLNQKNSPSTKYNAITGASFAEGQKATSEGSACAGFVSEAWPTKEIYQELLKLPGKNFMTDSLSDFLTRIKNGYLARKPEVSCPLSKLVLSVAKIMEEEGYLEKVAAKDYTIKAILKYASKKPSMENFKRISKPGLRVYIGYQKIRKPFGGLGISIISTPSGVMTGEKARKLKLGGEFLCQIW